VRYTDTGNNVVENRSSSGTARDPLFFNQQQGMNRSRSWSDPVPVDVHYHQHQRV
jgi:hypothetical protein